MFVTRPGDREEQAFERERGLATAEAQAESRTPRQEGDEHALLQVQQELPAASRIQDPHQG